MPHAGPHSPRRRDGILSPVPRTAPRIERLQPWLAGLGSALVHLLWLLALLLAPPITMTPPQGAPAGGRQYVTQVDFIGETATPAPPEPVPPVPAIAREPRERTPRPTPAPPSRVRATDVERADEAVAAIAQPQAPPPPPPTRRRSPRWGQPPGMLRQDHAPVNAGPAPTPAIAQGAGTVANSAERSLQVGGYQVYYDLRSERRLRAWAEQGITELFLPLPGSRQLMICPLEVALRRDSGNCRMLEPDSPELMDIGDARQVIDMMQVYRRGEPVWRGPGPYR